ncbi:hypothetical protein HC256_002432 [Beauveria bassiana]|nr:hypothetical protein HC256_002432 [Beauveria bassiana]
MNSPITDRKSGFERLFASNEGQNELCRQLERAKAARQEATPEPSSPDDYASTAEDFKWQCDILYKELAGEDIESIRLAVTQPDYWATECRQYADVLQQLLLQTPNEGENKKTPTAQQWRTAASGYKHIIKLHGMSVDEADRIRHSIDDQKYWAEEVEVLQQRVAFLEHQLYEDYWGKKLDIQRERKERVKRCLQSLGDVSPPRPMHPSPNKALQPDGSIATRTRSKTRIDRKPKSRRARNSEAGPTATSTSPKRKKSSPSRRRAVIN